MVPMMTMLLGFSQKMAQGISLAVIIPVAISGTISHARRGNVRPAVAFWLAVGGMSGGVLGGMIAVGHAKEWQLKAAFGLLMVFVGWLMFRQKPRDEKPKGHQIEVAAREPV